MLFSLVLDISVSVHDVSVLVHDVSVLVHDVSVFVHDVSVLVHDINRALSARDFFFKAMYVASKLLLWLTVTYRWRVAR